MEKTEKTVFLIGAGMGSPGLMTEEGGKALFSSRAVLGAPRLLETEMVSRFSGPRIPAVSPEEILREIERREKETPPPVRFAVLFSGDVGFFSGAGRVRRLLEERRGQEFKTVFLPGISSMQYFCARLQIPWERVRAVSLHGRQGDPAEAVRQQEMTFFLTDRKNGPGEICRRLTDCGMGDAVVFAGERLSYPDERILRGTAEELADRAFSEISVLLVQKPEEEKEEKRENTGAKPVSDPERPVTHGLEDDSFFRGEAPMTKSEIRSISLSKLRICRPDILFDIGAGTGSTAVEMALQASEGKVFAIEYKEEALELIRRNRQAFSAENLTVVPGRAPEVLTRLWQEDRLPAPDKVLIGGSGGRMEEIIARLAERNPAVRIVANAIMPESAVAAVRAMERLGFRGIEMIQVSVAKGRPVSSGHLMTAQNPVFILSGSGPDGKNPV